MGVESLLIGAAIGGGSAALTGGDFGDVLTGAALGAAGRGVSGSLSSGATGGSFLESLGTDTLSSLSTGLSIFSGAGPIHRIVAQKCLHLHLSICFLKS
jgi:hypothetical protein